MPRPPFPSRLYVRVTRLREGDDWHLFAYDVPPDDTTHGEPVGIYTLTETRRQVVTRELAPMPRRRRKERGP